jgi:hypothetical protein
LIASLAGFTVFVVLLLVAVQVLFDLYARSAVTAAGFEAARRVAGYDVATLPANELARAEAEAEAQARRTLGRYGAGAKFNWALSQTDVAVRVRVLNTSLVPTGLARAMGIDTIDRTVHVHAERFVCPGSSTCHMGGTPGR